MCPFLKIMGVFALSLISGGVSLSAQDSGQPTSGSKPEKPFWSATAMSGDPLLFIQKEGASAASAKLLFPADSDLRITSVDEKQVYELNRDYTWQPGSDTITSSRSGWPPPTSHGWP